MTDDDKLFAPIAARALKVAEAALRNVTDDAFVPTEKNVRLFTSEASGNSIIGVKASLPSSLAASAEDAQYIADRARDYILAHSKQLQELNNDVAFLGDISTVKPAVGGYEVGFSMYGTYQDLAAADVPMPSIVTGRSDRPLQ